jgi:hypothetical protein
MEQKRGGSQMRGTSYVPLILGIIGSILLIPGLLCASCIGAVVQSGGFVFIFGFLPIIGGIAGGIFGKLNPTLSMIIFIVSAFFTGMVWVLTAFISTLHLAAMILFIVAAVIAKVQKMED